MNGKVVKKHLSRILVTSAWAWLALPSHLQAAGSGLDFDKQILPVLKEFCYDCHSDGVDKGGLELDLHKSHQERLSDHKVWLAVWENLRAQMMPPSNKPQPTVAQKEQVMLWIERDVFKVDPENPDPGRITLRRLNREEYEFTVRDLLGVRFNADENFPPDDTGYGFDTIGDVLSISPLLMEKYIEAAREIVQKSIHSAAAQVPTADIWRDNFKAEDEKVSAKYLPFSVAQSVSAKHWIHHPGPFDLEVEMSVSGSLEATNHTAKLILHANDKAVASRELGWDNSRTITLKGKATLTEGANNFRLELQPLSPPGEGEKELALSIRRLKLRGPTDGSYLIYPEEYRRVFTEGAPPDDPEARRQYATRILERLATRAFRRPIDAPSLKRLVDLAVTTDEQPGFGFEDGIAQSLTAILASPRFLFRAEFQPEPNNPSRIVPLDEYSLASRLSYFLWSSLPDDTLMELAAKGQLRKELDAQLDRMIQDPKIERFVNRFVGQWLQARDVETIGIDPRRVLRIRDLGEALKVFNGNLRRAMREETEMLFSHVLKEKRPARELLTADYSFLNEELAKWYGIEDVKGREMRKVSLDPSSHRGGVLTHSSVLIVTSNPTRTSPVKRGLFVLENLLGTPAPPAPPNVAQLEEAAKKGNGKTLTMREMMEIHRQEPLCASCHARMDPLGLALENYDALGRYREEERGEPIQTGGVLITGETFETVTDLAKVLSEQRQKDFYRCLAEKMLTYAVGRGMEYYDSPTLDHIVKQLTENEGTLRTLVREVVLSAPFQKRRGDGDRLQASAQ